MSVTFAPAQPSIAGVGDYIELMKPRVMSLVVFTAFVGLMIAPGHLHPVIAITAILCIAVGAGAAGALNMWYDADIDARMERTAKRPIPAGRVAPGEALAFGLTLATFSVVVLGLLVNVVAGALLAATIGFYVLVYTMWLKRRTPQNIVIGGAAGALPPVIGWAAVTGERGPRADPAVPHHLLLDAAAFLGAVALSHRGLRARRRPDAAGRRRRNGNAPPNPALLAASGPAWRGAVALRLCRTALWRGRARRGRGHGRAGAAAAQQNATAMPPASGCSPFRSSICSCCSPCCWSIGCQRR